MKIKDRFFKFLFNLLQSNSTPEAIAAGFALGTSIAILPTPGFGIFLALFITVFFKKINKLAIAAAFTIWNPLVQAPLYWLSYVLGGLLFKPDPSLKFDIAIFDQLYHYSSRFLLGNLLIVIIITPIVYVVAYRFAQVFLRSQTMQEMVRAHQARQLLQNKKA
ncbi:MAG: DUF2062 domain-containing protein [Cyclobacteriaceae bacterium]